MFCTVLEVLSCPVRNNGANPFMSSGATPVKNEVVYKFTCADKFPNVMDNRREVDNTILIADAIGNSFFISFMGNVR